MNCLKIFFYTLALLIFTNAKAQQKDDTLLVKLLKESGSKTIESVMKDPNFYRCQIIYTQINRSQSGKMQLKNYKFNVNPDLYYNPASMVKMPLAFLSIEKLKTLKKYGINRNTTMGFDSSYTKQVAMINDSSSKNGFPSLEHFIKRAFLISENDPYNRMYQFVGQQNINRKLHEKGYRDVRITRQFMGFSEDQNRHTNAIHFYDDKSNILYSQPAAYNPDSFYFKNEIKIGKAHWNRDDSLIHEPFDFTKHNNVPLEDFRHMLQSVIFPESVNASQRFVIDKDDRKFLLKYLSQYPSETDYPKYDTSVFYDSYVKFYFQDSSQKIPSHIRVFNKVGWAYGFMTDVSYILDTKNNIDYMIAATIYVNSDEVVNDNKYDYENIGLPFFHDLGKTIHQYELSRKRNYHPTLQNQVIKYDKRNPSDKRAQIKNVDN